MAKLHSFIINMKGLRWSWCIFRSLLNIRLHFKTLSTAPLLLNYLENRGIYTKCIGNKKGVSLLWTPFIRNMFHSNKYSASYDRDARVRACSSSCKGSSLSDFNRNSSMFAELQHPLYGFRAVTCGQDRYGNANKHTVASFHFERYLCCTKQYCAGSETRHSINTGIRSTLDWDTH